ncbi:MAG: hypothetical protein COA42_17530 [Alteromonadaceae bacterium]|nr:MAG: hypothetical protein COA42_17530 [Alteromonadaceae bacterium]
MTLPYALNSLRSYIPSYLSTCIKVATIAGAACFSHASLAGYTIEQVDFANVGFNAIDTENGQVLVAVAHDQFASWKVSLYEDGNETLISDSSTKKDNVGISDGVYYWTENTNESAATVDELYQFKNGNITQITNTGRKKQIFKYDGGQASWYEEVDGRRQVFYYDGSEVIQVTNISAGSLAVNNGRNLHLDNGEIAYLFVDTSNVLSVYYWNGLESTLVSQPGVRAIRPNLEDGTIVWIADAPDSMCDEVYKYQDGLISQVTFDSSTLNGCLKTNSQIKDGTISWQNWKDHTGQNFDLYIQDDNGAALRISDQFQGGGYAQFDNGKVYFTEGVSGTPSSIFEYDNGTTSLIHVGPNTVAMKAKDGHVIWREGFDTLLVMLASPDLVDTDLNLGAEHSENFITVNGNTTVHASQWSGWNWTPTYLEVGIEAVDGLPLDGITVTDESGRTWDLSGNSGAVAQTFTWNSRNVVIHTETSRELKVLWWATTTPNIQDIGAEHSLTNLDLSKPVTIKISQWSNWGWTPRNIVSGFGRNGGAALDGIKLYDKNGTEHTLWGDWFTVYQPFYWEPVQLVIPAQYRNISVQWWAEG